MLCNVDRDGNNSKYSIERKTPFFQCKIKFIIRVKRKKILTTLGNWSYSIKTMSKTATAFQGDGRFLIVVTNFLVLY